MNNKPIFIGGLMKSGTTLLRTMLSNHRNIFPALKHIGLIEYMLKIMTMSILIKWQFILTYQLKLLKKLSKSVITTILHF